MPDARGRGPSQHAAARTTGVGDFLSDLHARFVGDGSGQVADYIPALAAADPRRFGLALATMDGHVYAVGDSGDSFTIQSISKAFAFALAIDVVGEDRLRETVGVEPSGEAFNAIRLDRHNRPFNPMVNAGAIACAGLIHEAFGKSAQDKMVACFSRFAGRELTVDERVFASERDTGDRNRAIAYLLRNQGIVRGDVDRVLDLYFLQCSVLVTAVDLAWMGATLANGGLQPRSGEACASPIAVARALSVMSTCGMYDFAGEWIYRVGIPAKSGVGGGILAALPSEFGFASYSPPLDEHGNSLRGLKSCEGLSQRFGLHVLAARAGPQNVIAASYTIDRIGSRRDRRPSERLILARHGSSVLVVELAGSLTFSRADYVSRHVDRSGDPPAFLVLDMRGVAFLAPAGADFLSTLIERRAEIGLLTVLVGKAWNAFRDRQAEAARTRIRCFETLDSAIEWVEDQIVHLHGGFSDLSLPTALADQPLLAGLAPEDIAALTGIGAMVSFAAGQRIIALDEPSNSFYLLLSGTAGARSASGIRLSTIMPGTAFGEMALLGHKRTAEVFADTAVKCVRVTITAYEALVAVEARIGAVVSRNIALLLADRLAVATDRIDALSINWGKAAVAE